MSVDRRAVVPAIAVLVVGGIFAFAPPASASTPTVSETGGVVTYTAPAGENNGVVVNDTATEVLVLDNAYALTPGAGCTAVTGNTHEVQCARAANASVVVHLGDGTNGVNNATNLPSSLYGGSGDDLLGGGGGNDKLYGYGGNDKLYGYAGNDLLVGGTGADLLNGGSGNDTVSYADHTTRVTANLFGFGLADDGNATDGPEGARDNILNNVENLTGGSGNDVLIGSDVRNVINGGAGGDIIYGGPGDDLLYGGAGKDVIDGSTGNDECFVQTPTDAIPTAADGSTIHCEITQLPH